MKAEKRSGDISPLFL